MSYPKQHREILKEIQLKYPKYNLEELWEIVASQFRATAYYMSIAKKDNFDSYLTIMWKELGTLRPSKGRYDCVRNNYLKKLKDNPDAEST